MEFAGAPLVLIGQTDTVAYTTTTAQLRIVDTFFEQIVNENSDALRYNDEGTPAPLVAADRDLPRRPRADCDTRLLAHATSATATAARARSSTSSATRRAPPTAARATTLVDAGAFDASFVGGYVAIVDGHGARADPRRSPPSRTRTRCRSTRAGRRRPTTRSVYVAVKPRQQHHGGRDRQRRLARGVDHGARLRAASSAPSRRPRHPRRRAPHAEHAQLPRRRQPGLQRHRHRRRGNGNIGYWSSGFSRIPPGRQDPRLPIDGTQPNPLIVASGTVASATATTLTRHRRAVHRRGLLAAADQLPLREPDPAGQRVHRRHHQRQRRTSRRGASPATRRARSPSSTRGA